MGLWIRLLGDFAVFGDGVSLPEGDAPRGLLALLALSAGEWVPEERLIAGLSGTTRRAWARRALAIHTARVRVALGPEGDRVERRPGSLRLDAGPDEVDVARFRALVAEGSERALHHALSLWHGEPLSGLERLPFVPVEARRLRHGRALAMQDLDAVRV